MPTPPDRHFPYRNLRRIQRPGNDQADRAREVGLHQTEAAIWYLHRHLNGEPLDLNTLHLIDCRNVAMPAAAVYIDEIEPTGRPDRIRATRYRHLRNGDLVG